MRPASLALAILVASTAAAHASAFETRGSQPRQLSRSIIMLGEPAPDAKPAPELKSAPAAKTAAIAVLGSGLQPEDARHKVTKIMISPPVADPRALASNYKISKSIVAMGEPAIEQIKVAAIKTTPLRRAEPVVFRAGIAGGSFSSSPATVAAASAPLGHDAEEASAASSGMPNSHAPAGAEQTQGGPVPEMPADPPPRQKALRPPPGVSNVE